jgi:hypothetical protein
MIIRWRKNILSNNLPKKYLVLVRNDFLKMLDVPPMC